MQKYLWHILHVLPAKNKGDLGKSLYLFTKCYCSHVHSNRQKSMKIAFVDGIFAHWLSLTYGQRSKCADLCGQ